MELATAVPDVGAMGRLLDGAGYLADAGLASALFCAVRLPQPILLEGEAGVGKTEAAKALADAVQAVAERGIARESSSVVVRYVARIASRFSVTVTEKVAAESVPVLGAASGAAINVLFTRHFQDMGRGHFIIRRLERRYGPAPVRSAYEALPH